MHSFICYILRFIKGGGVFDGKSEKNLSNGAKETIITIFSILRKGIAVPIQQLQNLHKKSILRFIFYIHK